MVRRTHAPGFTLVELMVVVALIGILATLGLLITQRLIQRAKASATATQMAFIRTGLLNLATNCEGLPLTARGSGDPESAEREARALAGEAVDEKPRPFPWARLVMAILVLANLGLGGYLLLTGELDPAVAERMEAVNVVSRAVAESRDAAGRYPASLASVLPALPVRVADLVRADVIQYETNPERTQYEVTVVVGRP